MGCLFHPLILSIVLNITRSFNLQQPNLAGKVIDMEMDPNPSSSRVDRKTIEKNRRNQMKALYMNLNALLPHQSHSRPREMVSLPDQLEGATSYIKTLQARLEKMKQKKKCLEGLMSCGHHNLPNIDVRVTASAVEVVLITGLNCQFIFNGIIRLLQQHGADVFSASFSVLENTVCHTIHAQINYEAARISEILRKFVYDCV